MSYQSQFKRSHRQVKRAIAREESGFSKLIKLIKLVISSVIQVVILLLINKEKPSAGLKACFASVINKVLSKEKWILL